MNILIKKLKPKPKSPIQGLALISLKSFRLYLTYCFLFLLISTFEIRSQNDSSLDIKCYNFIQYNKNKFEFPADSIAFERFYAKIDTLILTRTGKITIVHIGGSHIQADIYSGHTRERLQNYYPGMNGGRGMVFPYKIANTNNPRSYYFKASGYWNYSKNTELKKSNNLGLTGITLITSDSLSKIDFHLRNDSIVTYTFNRIRIFHSMDSISFIPLLEKVEISKTEINSALGYTTFYLNKEYTTFSLKLKKTTKIQIHFELYGISLENDSPGIIYHSIGVNGASIPSYLRCNLLEKHLKALKPDLVIISLGTNDAYTTHFKPGFYQTNYEELIRKIRRAAPLSAILAMVSNDSYLYKRYPNKNTQLASDVIYSVAKKYDCGVWDFYQIMGGFNSSPTWRKNHLMINDLIHFSEKGYVLMGDLLFNALIKSYDNHINSIIRN